MERQILLILTLVLIALVPGQAQQDTRPMLGVTRMPESGDSIRPFTQIKKPDLKRSGFRKGEKVPDFQLYTLEGERFRLQEALSQGRPVLLIGASYTCPKWNMSADFLKRFAARYAERVLVLIVYTLEAHPVGGFCAADPTNEIPDSRLERSLQLEQPFTYGQRVEIARAMVDALDIRVPVLIDDPANSWWSHFGPAFNRAYLILPDGTVGARQDWFMDDNDGTDLECEIALALGDRREPCQGEDSKVPFLFIADVGNNSILKGTCGDKLVHSGNLVNQTKDTLTIQVAPQRQIFLPEDWSWSWTVGSKGRRGMDTLEIRLAPGQHMPFAIWLLTSTVPEESNLSFLFISGEHRSRHRFQAKTQRPWQGDPPETRVFRRVGSHELRLQVWKPKGWKAGDKRPALLLFHGGGWTRGQPENLDEWGQVFSTLGFVTCSAEYRLSDSLGTSMRESIDDAFRAIAWVRAHADSLGIDPDHIVAGGGSAGAHLAACLGSLESFRGQDGRKGTLPNALVLAAPALRLDSAVMTKTRITLPLKDRAAFSPLDHLGKHHPPALLLFGANDRIIPASQPREYVEALKSLGIKASLEVFPDTRHAFYTTTANLDEISRLTLDFLQELGWEVEER